MMEILKKHKPHKNDILMWFESRDNGKNMSQQETDRCGYVLLLQVQCGVS